MDRIRAEAKQFMEDYYRTFDTNRVDLVNLFQEESMLNFKDREIITGKEAIVAKLTSVQCQYHISNLVCVTDIPTRGAVAQVTGFIWLDGKQEAVHFCQEDDGLDEMGIFVDFNITTSGDPFIRS
ncbi:nuclear transport factor 2B-like [Syzygium oleosum]|uniref:nuclear transport factor 2B-like n=1 Tax=Syzygium oleosum TaxID=219896 RepID=UPI0024BB9091|nr:nuclear transport factor 2B-like [Syzygium oleosum]